MNKFAFLFPGQGSQSTGMGRDFFDNFSVAKKIFKTADEILNKNISKLCFEGSEEDLKQTQNSQPAILLTSIVALDCFKSEFNLIPSFVAGHSLGEYAAMYSSGVFDLETALELIQKRADLMSEVKGGAMAAVLNADENILKECLKEALNEGYVDIANYNSPTQTVITGEDAAIQKASELLLSKGVKRVIPLAVSGAFHSKLMQNAGIEFEKFIKDFSLNEVEIPVITNVDAEPTYKDFKPKMSKQIYSSVKWVQSIEYMINQGTEYFIEFGNGKVLAGLNKKISNEIKTFNVFDTATLENTIIEIKEIINE